MVEKNTNKQVTSKTKKIQKTTKPKQSRRKLQEPETEFVPISNSNTNDDLDSERKPELGQVEKVAAECVIDMGVKFRVDLTDEEFYLGQLKDGFYHGQGYLRTK